VQTNKFFRHGSVIGGKAYEVCAARSRQADLVVTVPGHDMFACGNEPTVEDPEQSSGGCEDLESDLGPPSTNAVADGNSGAVARSIGVYSLTNGTASSLAASTGPAKNSSPVLATARSRYQ
jgi:hypothetical protein